MSNTTESRKPIGYFCVYRNGQISGWLGPADPEFVAQREALGDKVYPFYGDEQPAEKLVPVAEVIQLDGEKIIDASMEFFDKHPIGTKLYTAQPAEINKDKLRARLRLILSMINQLEWKTGVGGWYFEMVQEQLEAIVEDFGLEKLPPHVLTMPIDWIKRDPLAEHGYVITEPRGKYTKSGRE